METIRRIEDIVLVLAFIRRLEVCIVRFPVNKYG